MTMSPFALLALCFVCCGWGLRTDNPPGQLGKTAMKTVGQLARTQVKGQGFKGFKGFKGPGPGFQFKPQTLNGFGHAPSYAFNGFRSQTGQLGRGFGTFGGQMGRMPMGTMQNNLARRFASTGAQLASKGVDLLSFQNFPPGVKDRIIFAVETAAGKSTRQQMARSIRESFWSIFKYPNNDVHVLISQGEMAFAKAAEGGVARFKIRHGGQDLFVTLLKRSGKPVNFGAPINFGHGTMSDLDILRRFGKGLYDLQNIFRLQSVEWIYKQTQEVFSKGLSPDKMAQRLESLVQQKWGGGWNVIVSPNKITAGVNQNDVKAAFKVADYFVTFLRRVV